MIDIHCHILPDLDDGPSNMEKAVDMALLAVRSGTTQIIATPHFKNGVFEVSSEMVIDSVKMFTRVLEEKKISLKVLPGAEIRISPDSCLLLDQGELLPLGCSRYYLFELPDIFIKEGIITLLRQLRQREVIPVIAHPERNRTIQRHLEMIPEFIFENALFQITGKSITGENGKRSFKIAWNMVKEGQVHFVASDGHSIRHRPPCLDDAVKAVKKAGGKKAVRTIFEENPAKILAGSVMSGVRGKRVI
ncbi:tyrosine-protein phosphatase [Desulfobacter curvatus]|uniref:tyrosine-protein phosphatase n=1 Tax=Desulfobacter curvatus TaxID=2290 RepID=UPI0003716EE1|nr:CpsB/CapC family capsule biosynthesis tyrosine phosphatase [Desulfobacter curvatus]